MKKAIHIILILTFWFYNSFATNYYVDFDSGNDNNSGTSTAQAWKHAPGDINATANPAEVVLLPGDIVYFKGGVVYRGNINLNASGDSIHPIIYKGDGWGSEKAIIDGSMELTSWTQLNDSIFYADIPAAFTIGQTSAALNLHEYNQGNLEDEFMWTAQWPNPNDFFFYDDYHNFAVLPTYNLTLTSITDSIVFNQADSNYWNYSSLLIWTNPNRVVLREITSFSPELRTVYFDSLHVQAIYPDGRDQAYAIYNSIHALDVPGEYYVNFEENRIYIYPRDANNVENSITLSVREYGFNIAQSNGITIEGFIIRKHSGDDLRAGIGIGGFTGASYDKFFYKIRNNYITHNRHPVRGYGGIYMPHVNHCLIENNEVVDNFRHAGIFCTNAQNVIVNNNIIRRSGATSLTFYTMRNSQITNNSVLESKGGHANGMSIYMASKDILVAGNTVIDCANSISFQDGGNIYFVNNFVDSRNYNTAVNEWGRTSRGPWEYGEIVFVNNTFMSITKKPAVNIENSLDTIYTETDTIYPNIYYSFNNIIDAGGGNTSTQRGHNLYTSLAWNQNANYDWSLQDGEIVEENLELIFSEPEEGDFSLCENSPAIAMGTDVTSLLPSDKFPDFNFNADINGFPRPEDRPWSVGAYEYNSPNSINDNTNFDRFKNSIFIYPNPTRGILKFKGGNHNIQSVSIFDLSGKTIIQRKQIHDNESIDLSHLQNGVYIIRIQTDTEVITAKIIKV